MKKFISIMALLLTVGIEASAQKKLGDYIEIGGVPAFVFYLDQSGEHGLAMSFPVMTSQEKDKVNKRMAKISKKANISAEELGAADEVLAKHPLLSQTLTIDSDILTKKAKKQLFQPLIGKLGDEGRENAKIIEAYCQENNIDMEHYFPWEYLAKQIGDGWFVPGDKELCLFAGFYLGGVGKQYGISNVSFLTRGQSLSDNPIVQSQLIGIVQFGLMSSTAKFPEFGFRTLHHVSNALKGWLDLLDNLKGDTKETAGVKTCFVHEF